MRFHRVARSRVAAEGAFCEHLRMLRRMLGPRFDSVVVAAPTMAPAQFERDRGHLGEIDEDREGIRWVALHPFESSATSFWLRHSPRVLRRLWNEVRRAGVVHSSISHNLWRPFEFASLLFARLLGRKTVCVVDIDLRDEARMNFSTGRWSRKSLLLCRSIYDPLRDLQMRAASRSCSLVLLKGRKLCRDYGAGRANVKYFLDAAFSGEQVISQAELDSKLRVLEDDARPLELVYFGRLTPYKGVDRCLEAVARAKELTQRPLRLHLIGGGEQERELRDLAERLELGPAVEFHGPVPYGPRLFEALRSMDLALAAPLSEDTPRSALDAMARGIPILAFDTEYYRDFLDSGAVDVVAWPSVGELAERIAHYADDKRRLVPLARAAVEFARTNTQDAWLRSRVDWTLQLFDSRPADAERLDGVGKEVQHA